MSPFEELVSIMTRLRSPTGCPWDREQTHLTLRPYLIEEAYEVLDALDNRDDGDFRDELGDLLLQVVFHAQIATEEQRFDIDDVARAINDKLVRRHPHVFGNTRADTADEVLTNWEKIKREEKGGKSRKSVLDGLPAGMPALLHAYRIQEKVARVNFDWDDVQAVLLKVGEEIDEVSKALEQGDKKKIEEEMGDLLFSMVNLSRHLNVPPEDALRRSNDKFMRRFRYIEAALELRGENLERATFEELDALWEEAKQRELDGNAD
jgi:tetrapyrrole methylase family protein/MazG family protein